MKRKPAIAFHTLGCKLNQAESELLAQQFARAGYCIANGEKADICILNTCTVTHIADRKSRQLLRSLRKKNPEATLIATGCYAERAPQELAQIGANLVVDNKQKMHLLELTNDVLNSMPCHSAGHLSHDSTNRVRSFIKIQDGCNDFCTYCIVPEVRGQEYCLPVTEIIKEIETRVSAGYREVILTGTKIGAYRYQGANLRSLVEQILVNTNVERLHLSSLQPQEISPELLSLWQDSRLCHHFHLALQSGNDTILKRMGRRYSIADYREAVSSIRKVIPDAAITTDIMVGFPGESASEFQESYRFCQEMGFANIHVFSYSPRPGTLAARMPDSINAKLKKDRSQQMLELAQISARNFCERSLGQTTLVLWENEVKPGSGIYSGLSHNYIRVFAESQQPLTNQLLSIRLIRLHHEGLWGEVIR